MNASVWPAIEFHRMAHLGENIFLDFLRRISFDSQDKVQHQLKGRANSHILYSIVPIQFHLRDNECHCMSVRDTCLCHLSLQLVLDICSEHPVHNSSDRWRDNCCQVQCIWHKTVDHIRTHYSMGTLVGRIHHRDHPEVDMKAGWQQIELGLWFMIENTCKFN